MNYGFNQSIRMLECSDYSAEFWLRLLRISVMYQSIMVSWLSD